MAERSVPAGIPQVPIRKPVAWAETEWRMAVRTRRAVSGAIRQKEFEG
jgi:hypothetical protein